MPGIHYNSVKAIKVLKKGGKHNRILAVHHMMGRPLTDREVKEIGKFDDMNEIRPRTTELLSEDYGCRLEQYDDILCVKTKVMVRRTRLVKQRELFT